MSADQPLVLIVEDEPDLADLYATWLREKCRVRVAYGGREALDELDDDVDVVLLDRRMPDLSGDEALTEIRNRGFECRVAMVTAVEPDFDIVAMGFDDYLVKPVSKEALEETVENLLRRNTYNDGVQELFSLASKKALLESEKDPATLEDNEEYQELDARLSKLREDLDETLQQFDEERDIAAVYRDLGDTSAFENLESSE
ncbi:response regulator with chey-like receiver domain and winged-helix DNA-binding domain [Halogeometricum borinquense DSM 11551]|uniref:response regulator with CheY-like receiver domain and Winged-helix DNA-binding domain n=2 Tax=Halogeometricum borinquense TaxID=60847 RepID=E4NNR1_HALBP|nr:HalX domain-containing protein [Halogeometricum borinquense]ADQ67525.1 response regulator with CheY-like receiver domain and winged-helix DNA-binding domain [Halogeometricum borinquense DSM 11551]ELY23795.1 response regulator with chey-like receiver domain and winged-helix DNA-binding domain [Halogeometricum borinquense DSM 11551]RYJ13506.1 response regulator [Halogeometricum borinquense]